MNRRELVMLAHPLDIKKDRIAGRMMSEKLDGQRAWWDGGISRGCLASEVPYANTDKDGRYIDSEIRATGLWSRYGKVIHAPDWWIDLLPSFPLDGELWMGKGTYQKLRKVVSRLKADDGWYDVQYRVFDWPTWEEMFEQGRVVSGMHYEKIFDADTTSWVDGHTIHLPLPINPMHGIRYRYESMLKWKDWQNGTVIVHDQEILSMSTDDAQERIDERMDDVLSAGGEGLILRSAHSKWKPKRTRDCLKVKTYNDDEALIVGYTWGKKTKKGSRLLGLMGTLVVEWNGLTFELGSGFNDDERRLTERHEDCPGEAVDSEITNPDFPRGSYVTFKYRELTDDGLPKEGTYFRRR